MADFDAERDSRDIERYSLDEIAALSGLDVAFLGELRRAAGLPVPEPDARTLTDADLDAARTTRTFADAGIERQAMLEIVRILGRGLGQAADAIRRLTLDLVYDAEADEHELATRYASTAETIEPLVAPLADPLLRLHLRHAVRSELLAVAEARGGPPAGARDIAVCFADLVGFTRIGEELDPEELGEIAAYHEAKTEELIAPPVRLVKAIGDAVMLVSPDVDALIDAALTLVENAEAEAASDGYLRLKAGIAHGAALPRAGDWYGRPVNLASRITDIAPAGGVLCLRDVRGVATGSWDWLPAGTRSLRGLKEPVGLVRVLRQRPARPGAHGPRRLGL